MNEKGKNMNSELEKLKYKLDEAVNNSQSIEELQTISCKIDEEIEKCYLQVANVNACKKYLDRPDELEIISQIRKNLLDIYYNISKLELNILSENIYDYCCLMVHRIPKQKITRYFLDKNSKLYDSLSEEQIREMTIEANIKIFKFLIEKYTKILKENNKMVII